MGEQGFDLFVYFIQLVPSREAFLAEMAEQKTGQNGKATKLGQKRRIDGAYKWV